MTRFWVGFVSFLLCALAPQNLHAAASQSATSVYTNYATSNVTTTPVTLISRVSYSVRGIQMFDSSGLAMVLTVTSGALVTTMYVPPGGQDISLKMSQGDLVQLSTVSGTASAGINILTVLY